ncbi:MAG TPA: endonuclease III [Bacteroidota bacterium]|nr:endonuclease III [Bacteroidota bacterium]
MSPRETKAQLIARAKKLRASLHKSYPNPKVALDFQTPLQLLVATILSAQCTDVRVNKVTPSLFKKYPTAKHLANAKLEELEQDIRSTGFYHNKAKSLIACCTSIVQKHGGEVPKTMEELVELGGVGRKTANCVLGGAYGISVGVVVDTHVRRVAQRLGLSVYDDPEKIERDLMELIPQDDWYTFGNMLVWHGRNVCDARKPDCLNCPVQKLCPSAEEFLKSTKSADKPRRTKAS